jgi:uncharacterized protein (TIGR00369 family)
MPTHLHDIRDVRDPAGLNEAGAALLPGLLGIEVTSWAVGEVTGHLPLRSDLFAPHGFVHGATQIALADSMCGYGAATSLPPGAESFTTVDLTASLTGTAREGALHCTATRVHAGRSTQVWDATVTDDAGRTTCLFRCTQLVLWPRPRG